MSQPNLFITIPDNAVRVDRVLYTLPASLGIDISLWPVNLYVWRHNGQNRIVSTHWQLKNMDLTECLEPAEIEEIVREAVKEKMEL